jgi:hypothetical protein
MMAVLRGNRRVLRLFGPRLPQKHKVRQRWQAPGTHPSPAVSLVAFATGTAQICKLRTGQKTGCKRWKSAYRWEEHWLAAHPASSRKGAKNYA